MNHSSLIILVHLDFLSFIFPIHFKSNDVVSSYKTSLLSRFNLAKATYFKTVSVTYNTLNFNILSLLHKRSSNCSFWVFFSSLESLFLSNCHFLALWQNFFSSSFLSVESLMFVKRDDKWIFWKFFLPSLSTLSSNVLFSLLNLKSVSKTSSNRWK